MLQRQSDRLQHKAQQHRDGSARSGDRAPQQEPTQDQQRCDREPSPASRRQKPSKSPHRAPFDCRYRPIRPVPSGWYIFSQSGVLPRVSVDS